MSLWMGEIVVHELYTAACGLYLMWLACRTVAVLVSWTPLGVIGVVKKISGWLMLVGQVFSGTFGSVLRGWVALRLNVLYLFVYIQWVFRVKAFSLTSS